MDKCFVILYEAVGEVNCDTNNLVNKMFIHFKIPGPSNKMMSRNNLEKEGHQQVFADGKPASHQSAVKNSEQSGYSINILFPFFSPYTLFSFLFFLTFLLHHTVCQISVS